MWHGCKVKKKVTFCEANLKRTTFEACKGQVMLNMLSVDWINLAHGRGRSGFVNW